CSRRHHIDALPRGIACEQQTESIAALAGKRPLERRPSACITTTIVYNRRVGLHLHQSPVAIKDRALHRSPSSPLALLELLDHLRSLDKRNHVVDNFAITRKYFRRCDPFILSEVCWNDEVLNRVGHSRLYCELLTNIEDRIRLAESPPVGRREFRRRWKVP